MRGRTRPAALRPRTWGDGKGWAIGTPDLIVKTKELTVKGDAPDWWGEIPSVPTGLTEDRYVAALEIKEINDVESSRAKGNRATVGGRFVCHHMIWRTQVLDPAKADVIPDVRIGRSGARLADTFGEPSRRRSDTPGAGQLQPPFDGP